MEEAPVKPSVSKLAEKFKGQRFPVSTGHEEKPAVGLAPGSKGKHRNSALIEKLQANLSLSPTPLLPLNRGSELKLQPKPPGSTPPATPPLTPTASPQPTSKEEVPTSFETPIEGPVLHSFNKGRARLSVKRRPPTRQHRKSCNEEVLSGEDEKPLHSPESSKGDSGQRPAAEAAGNDCENAATTPAPAADPVTEGNSSAKEATMQEEDDVFAAEGPEKEEDTVEDVGKEASEHHLPQCVEESQPNTESGETAMEENQPRSPGD